MLIPHQDLSRRNTFGLGAVAAFGADITAPDQLAPLFAAARERDLPVRILGGGSNVLLRAHIPAVVATMAIGGIAVVGQDDTSTIIEAGAGVEWQEVVAWTVGHGLGGLENLAGIPGTVGAAPVQNIGAYGVELADRFDSLLAYDAAAGTFVSFAAPECRFGYRQSMFKDDPARFVIVSVRFRLPRRWQPVRGYAGLTDLADDVTPEAVMNRVLALRASKLPDWRHLGNAGSFFHNPTVAPRIADAIDGVPRYPAPDGQVKLSAAWLIEQCGFKGVREGGAGVYQHHALILVNHGGASFDDVAALSARIRAGVAERFGVRLVEEPQAL